MHDTTEYVVHIRNLKQALKHGLVLKKVHRTIIYFNKDEWLKPYIELNTELRKKAKNEFEKDIVKLMSDSFFGKTMENIRKYKDIKLLKTERRKNYLVSEPNYYSTKFFSESLMLIEMKKTQIITNKPVYLGWLILDLCKTVMYKFWYDCLKPKYGEKAKLGYMDTDRSITHVKTENIYKDTAEDVETRFGTSNYEIDRCLWEKIKKVVGLMKDELLGQIMKKFVGLRPKTDSYLKDNNDESIKVKGTKKCHKKKTEIWGL